MYEKTGCNSVSFDSGKRKSACHLLFIGQAQKCLSPHYLAHYAFSRYSFCMPEKMFEITAIETVNSELLEIKDIILNTVDCEKIYLFGSRSNGARKEGGDYDLYIVLKNEKERPVYAEQCIYKNLSKREGRHTPIDVLAETKNKFNDLCALPTIERKIAREGILLYDNARLA